MKKSLKVFAWLCLAALCLQGCTSTPATSDAPESSVGPSVSTSTSVPPSSNGTPTPSESEDDRPATSEVTLSEAELLDKMEGGWIGQMVGVTWAAPTEFIYAGRLMPQANMPVWTPDTINNAFGQDDVYVEIPFLDAMKISGYDCDASKVANKFKSTSFWLDHANYQGRENLKNGIKYPDSGSYLYNYHADDIDWQIECDFLGMMYPGMVNDAAKRAFDLGHIMNYGDGVYGGVFVTAMHSAAFTAESLEEIIDAGIKSVPEGTQFRALIDDVMASYKAGDTFEQNWQKLEEKWAPTDLCPRLQGVSNIDAKLNSGYILLGLLYGEGDFAKTIILSTRCGQDSDCNPSSAASILGNFLGASKIPAVYTKNLDRNKTKFSHTNYTYEQAVKLNFDLTKKVLEGHGAKNENGNWTFNKDNKITPVAFEQWPDGVFAFMNVSATGSVVRFIEVTPYSKGEKVASIKIDMGDGQVFDNVIPVNYTYEKAGTYTVKLTVTGDKGNVGETSIKVKIAAGAATPDFTVICNAPTPGGGGSKDPAVLYDGVVPTKATGKDNLQFDTYRVLDPVENPDIPSYIGYVYKEETTVSKVVFTEGGHFGNGGWFKNGLSVEVLVDGKWTAVEFTSDKAYPVSNTGSAFGDPYETFTFTLKSPVKCDGVRIYGLGGGKAAFISCAELAVS